MFAAIRLFALIIALVVIGSAVAYLLTGNRKYWVSARRTFMLGVGAALIFFAVMFVQEIFWPGGVGIADRLK